MPKTFKLMSHDNQHGHGVSLMVFDGDEMVGGFVLHTMPRPDQRDTYLNELVELTGFEVERL